MANHSVHWPGDGCPAGPAVLRTRVEIFADAAGWAWWCGTCGHTSETRRDYPDTADAAAGHRCLVPDVVTPWPPCPICDTRLEFNDGWLCVHCGATWDYDGTGGRWLPRQRRAVATAVGCLGAGGRRAVRSSA